MKSACLDETLYKNTHELVKDISVCYLYWHCVLYNRDGSRGGGIGGGHAQALTRITYNTLNYLFYLFSITTHLKWKGIYYPDNNLYVKDSNMLYSLNVLTDISVLNDKNNVLISIKLKKILLQISQLNFHNLAK